MKQFAVFLAVAPIYVMIMVSAMLPPSYRRVVEWIKQPPAAIYARCVPIPTRGQAMDGSVMYWRDERIHLSQCWEDS